MHGNHQENAERRRGGEITSLKSFLNAWIITKKIQRERERKRGGEITPYDPIPIEDSLYIESFGGVSLFIYLFLSLFSTRRENFLTYKMTSRRGRESSESQIDVTLLW